MPVVVRYEAHLSLVKRSVSNGAVSFRMRTIEKDQEERRTEVYSQELLDPWQVWKEFTAVRTEREALDFLRHNGDLTPWIKQYDGTTFNAGSSSLASLPI